VPSSERLPTPTAVDPPPGTLVQSWDVLNDLAQVHGDSFYIVDLDRFRSNYLAFRGSFRSRYASTELGYSYKTNYLPALCGVVDNLGGYAEVVSAMEYEVAQRLRVNPDRIIFNGPYKPPEHLAAALRAGSIVNLDGYREVDLVERIARDAAGSTLRVGLRCDLDTGGERRSRFGFDVDQPEFLEMVRRLQRMSSVRLVGLHCHVSSERRTPAAFARRVERLLGLAQRLFPDNPPDFLNLGGGYFGRMRETLRRQFPFPVPDYDEYAEAIAVPVAMAFGRDARRPQLILEPGTALVADVMSFVARVIDSKSVRGRRMAVCAGSIHNIKPTLHDKNLPVDIVSAGASQDGLSQAEVPFDIVGYTCMEHDVLHRGYDGSIHPGDFAVFTNVGAYTIVMKPPFIMPAAPILAHGSESGFVVARRGEQMADVFATYQFDGC
jgi:diaminopimelate decarboxylase